MCGYESRRLAPLALGPEEGKREFGDLLLPRASPATSGEVTSGWHCLLTPGPSSPQGGLTVWLLW